MFNLYVTQWSPNGTNDLLIVDPNAGHEIVAVIDEATFGVRVEIDGRLEYQTVAFEDFIGIATVDTLKRDECLTLIAPITLERVLSSRACNPMDPEGTRVRERLAEYFNLNDKE